MSSFDLSEWLYCFAANFLSGEGDFLNSFKWLKFAVLPNGTLKVNTVLFSAAPFA